MARINRRTVRVQAMRKALPKLRDAYKNAVRRCVEMGQSVTTDAAVNKAYDRLAYCAKELAQAQYTNLCAKEDAANWLKVCSAFKEAGLMYSPAYWAAHSAFSGQRYWAINGWRTEKMH